MPARPLIFERGSAGRSGASVPALDVPPVDPTAHFGRLARRQAPHLPEVSEPEMVRHYVELSGDNFAIDKGMYPLGSCTMKYNPKVNEWAARLGGFAQLHPWCPDDEAQGALALMHSLEAMLAEVCGMQHVSLHPAAGAQGELTGLMMIRAHHRANGRSPRKVLIPDTAHGTNPASCALNGLDAVPFPVGDQGIIQADAIAPLLGPDTAAIMLTNPNTVGLFERHLPEIADMAHAHGALVYGDGANLNAIMGQVRPGDLGIDVMQFNLHKTFTTPHGGGGPGCGPVAYKEQLAPYAPVPVVRRTADGTYRLDHDLPRSIGRMRSFHGNFGMMVRAYTYLRELGPEGVARASALAVLNANYLRVRLSERWSVPFNRVCMHEVVLDDAPLRAAGVSTMDLAKRLIDYGFHPPTVYFPLVVRGALLIEPTETESKETLDQFVEAMNAILDEAERDPDLLKRAPLSTRLSRLDETRAARQPRLRWHPPTAKRPAAPDEQSNGGPSRGSSGAASTGQAANSAPRPAL